MSFTCVRVCIPDGGTLSFFTFHAQTLFTPVLWHVFSLFTLSGILPSDLGVGGSFSSFRLLAKCHLLLDVCPKHTLKMFMSSFFPIALC
jgi:hypothetical protein